MKLVPTLQQFLTHEQQAVPHDLVYALIIRTGNGIAITVHRTLDQAHGTLRRYMEGSLEDAFWPADFEEALRDNDFNLMVRSYYEDNPEEQYEIMEVPLAR